jgi:hypothetical protein
MPGNLSHSFMLLIRTTVIRNRPFILASARMHQDFYQNVRRKNFTSVIIQNTGFVIF